MSDASDESRPSSLSSRDAAVWEAVLAGLPATMADLAQLVRIPSVSWPAFDSAEVDRSAGAVARLLTETGFFDTVQVHRARKGNSSDYGALAVLARRKARGGKPTALLYAHHDVQPPGREEAWVTPPYEPTAQGERLYGRGTADDKAGIMVHVGSIRALMEADARLGQDSEFGLVVFVEGEEEYGSASLTNFLADFHDELAADVIVVADSDNWDTNTPNLTVALRGAVAFNLRISTLEHASHSGMWGGAAPDAMMAAVKLLDTLWDDDGVVAVPGLLSHDEAVPDFAEDRLRQDAALLPGVIPIGRGPLLSRLWFQPSITVTGIDAPSLANASNTLVPEVSVRISARVAPGQSAREAADVIVAHLRAQAPFGAHLEVGEVDPGEPFLVDSSGWAAQAIRQAMADAWGVEPVSAGVGGSIPFIADLARVFPEAQVLVTGVEDPDTRAHSPNESLHLGVFRKALLSEALFLARLDS